MVAANVPLMQTGHTAMAVDITTARECYRRGPRPIAPEARLEKQWDAVRTQLLGQVRQRAFDRVPPAEKHLLSYSGRISGQGRRAAADGNVAESCRLFALAEQAVAGFKNLSEEMFFLCQTERAAAEAYLDCYCGDYEQAGIRLRESYIAAQKLDEEFGYAAMRLQRMHLLNNVIRVEALAKDYYRGLCIGRDLLRYLCGDAGVNRDADLWGLERADSGFGDTSEIDGAIKVFLTSQTLHEVALLMAMVDHETAQRHAAQLFEDVVISRGSSAWPASLRMWFDLKRLFVCGGDTEEVLAKGQDFLAGEDGSLSPLLWFTVALDVAAVCDSRPGGFGFEHEVLAGPESQYVPRLVPISRLSVAGRWVRHSATGN
jgi:hypothetical protein